jgi:hypothetical protein
MKGEIGVKIETLTCRVAFPRREGHHVRRGDGLFFSVHGSGNSGSDHIVCGAQRIGRQVSITRRRRRVLVAEQRANDRQAQPAGRTDAGETVPQIM